MKIIVTTGYPESGLDIAYETLVLSGLQEAGISRREGHSIHQIQEKILKAYEKDFPVLGRSLQISPSRVWQEFALNFMISNSNHNLWGWSDTRTVRLLDFWEKIEPEICFVLVYSSPEFAVSQALKNQSATKEKVEEVLVAWELYNSEILRFYHKHIDSCLLVNVMPISYAPEQFIEQAAKLFKLDLKFVNNANQVLTYELTALPALLASTLIAGYQDAITLYSELESSANLYGTISEIEYAKKLRVWQEYTDLLSDRDQADAERYDQSQQIQKLKLSLDEQVRLVKERQNRVEQLTEQLESINNKQSKIDAQQVQLAELTQENQLLLLQLHQVQEELEHYFLKYQELNSSVQRESDTFAFLTQFWQEQHPSEILIDMRREISGDNWYYAEPDGRWAGPANISTLKVPALRDGRYNIILDIADAIDPEIMTGLELSVNGFQTPLKIKEYYGGPEYFEAEFSTSEIQKSSFWDIQFKFQKLMSPTEHDPDDHRLIAIRLKSLSLSYL